MAWFETHWGRAGALLLSAVWSIQIYFVLAQWSAIGTGTNQTDGWHVQDGVSLFVPGNTSIANSLGPAGEGGSGGWCTNCGHVAQNPKCPTCDPGCYGSATSPTGGVAGDRAVPKGQTGVESSQACAQLCERQYNKAAGKGDLTSACQAWEYDPTLRNCYTYTLSMYPPIIPQAASPGNEIGWAVDVYAQRTVLRHLASTMMIIVPLVLFYITYNNYYFPSSLNMSPLTVALPLVAGIGIMGFLSLVGFVDSSPAMQFSCNAGLNQSCFADASTGGRRSGTCYSGCCAKTISCKVAPEYTEQIEGVWSTCTWPNVMCENGDCAASPADCKLPNGTQSGLMAKCDQGTTGGNGPINGADYGPRCLATDVIQNINYPDRVGPTQTLSGPAYPQLRQADPTQYPGEENTNPPAQAVQDTGQLVLQPGRTDNSVVAATGALQYHTFAMNAKVESFLKKTATGSSARTIGCGMATNKSTNIDGLFLAPAPASLQCVVPAGSTQPV